MNDVTFSLTIWHPGLAVLEYGTVMQSEEDVMGASLNPQPMKPLAIVQIPTYVSA